MPTEDDTLFSSYVSGGGYGGYSDFDPNEFGDEFSDTAMNEQWIKLDEKLVEDSNRVSRTPAKMTGGSEYLATDYDRPGLLDWSHLAPPEMPGTLGTAPAQQGLLDRGLAAYQPWRRPGVGEAFKYQPPAAPTYATRASLLGGGGTTVADTGGDTTTTTDNGGDTTKTSATSGTFMGQPYANQGEYMMLLDTHNKAMQLIRGGRTTMGIGELMGNSGLVNQMYMNVGNKYGDYTGGTDIDVGKKSASLPDTLLGGQAATTQGATQYPIVAAQPLDAATTSL